MKILLAYVPSATSEAALAYTIAEARRKAATVLVLASERGPDPRKASAVVDTRPLRERLVETGIDFELRMVPRRHDPADDILEAIRTEAVDLAVVGIRRRTPVGKMLLGSTSQRIIMEAGCPVVCVKPEGFVQPPTY